jgi:hypothetical protein
MTNLSRFGTVSLFVAGVLGACGDRTGLLVDDTSGASSSACNGTGVPVQLAAPNLYFVLDRSGSMKELNKWSTVRSVISDLIVQLGPHARFGAAEFPDPMAGDCSPGVQVMPLQIGDGQPAQSPGAAATFTIATSDPPAGGTPTADTFLTLLPTLSSLKGHTFAILATDGGPNCNGTLTCGVDRCTANIDMVDPTCHPNLPPNCCDPNNPNGGGRLDCLDDSNAVQAVTRVANAGVPTFVIGVPGSGPYSQVLDELATAGGTARSAEPFYYRVDTADKQTLANALADIAARIAATCELTLAKAPDDPNKVNVSLGGVLVPQDPTNGWKIAGDIVTLLGATCDEVLGGNSPKVSVSVGCPTVR